MLVEVSSALLLLLRLGELSEEALLLEPELPGNTVALLPCVSELPDGSLLLIPEVFPTPLLPLLLPEL